MPGVEKLVRVFGPIREFVVGFAVSGMVFYSIPISKETRANSKYYNGGDHHDEH
eukprot:m.15776 g.15776  ORF g.15776 m.15776 type:complete len:54 (+) comp8625_c0_seq1:160-321(+)